MTIGKTQKALTLTAKHAQWQLGESPIPVPGPKDVLVRIMATALNPIDWKVKTAFSRLISSYPHVGGVDGAGIVDEVGWEVTTVMKGDKMWVLYSFHPPNEVVDACNPPAFSKDGSRTPKRPSSNIASFRSRLRQR